MLSAPIYYSLELTPFCNNRCLTCSNVFARRENPLSLVPWQQIINSISPYAEALKLTGGEPTLHPEFEPIVFSIAKAGIPFSVFTNGLWSNPDEITGIFRELREIKKSDKPGVVNSVFRGLLISLHGRDAFSHEAFTNKLGTFKETCVNIRHAVNDGLNIHTCTVITKFNWNSLVDIVRYGQKLGVKRFVFNRYLGPPSHIEPSDDQLRDAINSIESMRVSGFPVVYGNCIPQCFAPSLSSGCWAGVAYCTIDPWGNLRPCNHSPTIAGNILDESLKAVWRNETMMHWRSLHSDRCEDCFAMDVCHGGCRALMEIRGADPLIRGALPDNLHLFRDLYLYEHSYPKISCRVISEPFGYAFVNGRAIIATPPATADILDSLNGMTSLKRIYERFGQDALDFIGSLYLHDLITLEQNPAQAVASNIA